MGAFAFCVTAGLMRRILKTGRWLYDGQVEGLVQLITEPVEPPESEGDPPCNADGDTFYVQYSLVDGYQSQSWRFATPDEAVAEAE